MQNPARLGASPYQEPRIVNRSSASQELFLGADVERAIADKDRNFKVLGSVNFKNRVHEYFNGTPNELPWATVGDFNGDGKKDVAVLGTSKDLQRGKMMVKAMVALSSPQGYKIAELNSWPMAGDTSVWRRFGQNEYQLSDWAIYLSLATPFEKGTHRIPRDRDGIKLESDSAVMGVYGCQRVTCRRQEPLRTSLDPKSSQGSHQ